MGKGPTYGEFTFPKSSTTFVCGYARGGSVKAEGKGKQYAMGGPVGPLAPAPMQGMGYKKGGHVKHKSHKSHKAAAPAIDPAVLASALGGGGAGGGALGQMAGAGGPPPAPPGGPAGPGAAPPPPGGPMMKVGGQVRKAGLNLSPRAHTDAPPRTVNVKARLSAGAAGSPENMKRGGAVKKYAMGGAVEASPSWVPDSWTYNGRAKKPMSTPGKNYAKGGMTHPDLKEDKALIKRAFGMHDTQLHERKHTNLTKLKRGGKC